jgi:hypothetical protein
MKLVGAISTAVLSLTLGAGIPAYAQQEQHEQQEEKEKSAQEREKKAQPEKPAKQADKNARQEDKNTKPEERTATQQERNNNREEKSAREQHPQEARPGKQDEHARGNGGRGRIPDDRFRANFGQEHRFRVNQADYNNRRFQYGGYWFGFEGSWPSNWQYTQEVFVIEIDGVYYLCNANYPGVNIALSISM